MLPFSHGTVVLRCTVCVTVNNVTEYSFTCRVQRPPSRSLPFKFASTMTTLHCMPKLTRVFRPSTDQCIPAAPSAKCDFTTMLTHSGIHALCIQHSSAEYLTKSFSCPVQTAVQAFMLIHEHLHMIERILTKRFVNRCEISTTIIIYFIILLLSEYCNKF